MKCSECGKPYNGLAQSWTVRIYSSNPFINDGAIVLDHCCGKACLMRAIDREVDRLLGIRRVEGRNGATIK